MKISPEAIKIIQAWWDEEPRGWRLGITSSVLADKLEEDGPVDPLVLHWLRRSTESVDLNVLSRAIIEATTEFIYAARIYSISSGTLANPTLSRMCRDAVTDLALRSESGYNTVLISGSVVLGDDTAGLLSMSREYRENVRAGDLRLPGLQGLAGMYGLPESMYGWRIVYNDWQPLGQIDFTFRDWIFTARVY